MTTVQLFCISFFPFLLITLLRKGSDKLSPAKVFLSLWCGAIFLTEYKFSGFQHQWHYSAWLVLFLGIFSLLVGIAFAHSIQQNTPIKTLQEIRKSIPHQFGNREYILFYSIVFLFLLYAAAYTAEVLIIGSVPLLSQRFDRSRIDFGVFGLHLFVNMQVAILLLNIEYALLKTNSRFRLWINWLIFAVVFISFGLLLQRFNYVLWAFTALAILYYGSHSINIKKVLFLVAGFYGFLAVIQTIRLSQYAEAFVYIISKMRYGREYAAFTEPYMYITMNLENFAKGVEKLQNFTYGVVTFDWILAVGGIKHWIIDYFSIESRPFLVSGYNTFPFFWNFYIDFGIFGVFIFSFLMGYFTAICHINLRRTGMLKWIVYYSLCFSTLLLSFFTNTLSMLNFAACVIALVLIHELVIPPGKTGQL